MVNLLLIAEEQVEMMVSVLETVNILVVLVAISIQVLELVMVVMDLVAVEVTVME